MRDEFDFKIHLFKKYVNKMGEEELRKKLNLKDWELEYAKRKTWIKPKKS